MGMDSGAAATLPRRPGAEEGEGDAAGSGRAVMPAPTRWCGKTSLSENASSTATATAASPDPALPELQRPQHPGTPWPGRRDIRAQAPLRSKELGGPAEPAVAMESLLPKPALVHAVFKH